MAKAEINPGNCGFITTVVATKNGRSCRLEITSGCKAIQKLAEELTEVTPMNEISFRAGKPTILELGAKYCTHAACPVPVGIIKTVELEAGMALPGTVSITITRTN